MQVFSKLAWPESSGALSRPSRKAVLPQRQKAFRVQGAVKWNITRSPAQHKLFLIFEDAQTALQHHTQSHLDVSLLSH